MAILRGQDISIEMKKATHRSTSFHPQQAWRMRCHRRWNQFIFSWRRTLQGENGNAKIDTEDTRRRTWHEAGRECRRRRRRHRHHPPFGRLRTSHRQRCRYGQPGWSFRCRRVSGGGGGERRTAQYSMQMIIEKLTKKKRIRKTSIGLAHLLWSGVGVAKFTPVHTGSSARSAVVVT